MIWCLLRLKNLSKSEPSELQSLPCLPWGQCGSWGQGTLPPRDNRGQNFTGGGDTAANRNVLRLTLPWREAARDRQDKPAWRRVSSFLIPQNQSISGQEGQGEAGLLLSSVTIPAHLQGMQESC